jgi:hypothetical protein
VADDGHGADEAVQEKDPADADMMRAGEALMHSRVRVVPASLVAVVVAVASLSGEIRFNSTWKHIDAGTVSFAGKKIAALVISNNDSLRVSGEESLTRELNARGLQAVPTYRIAPKEELQKSETAKPWLEKAGIEGVVALRPVSVESQRTYMPSVWSGPNYSTLWGYYGYGWTTVWIPGSGGSRSETNAVVETLIYSLPRNQLLWAAVTETTSARNLQAFVNELVKESVEVLHEQGLARRLSN